MSHFPKKPQLFDSWSDWRPCNAQSPYTDKAPYYGRCHLTKRHPGHHETKVDILHADGRMETVRYQYWMTL